MVVLRHCNHSSKLTAQSNRERDMRMGKTRELPRAEDKVWRVKVRVIAGKVIAVVPMSQSNPKRDMRIGKTRESPRAKESWEGKGKG